jgi:hypothetical protein
MRHGWLILVLASGIAPLTNAQDPSLCNPCVDPPGTLNGARGIPDAGYDRIRRDNFTSPNATTIITADDMREPGVITVGDMLRRMSSDPGICLQFHDTVGPVLTNGGFSRRGSLSVRVFAGATASHGSRRLVWFSESPEAAGLEVTLRHITRPESATIVRDAEFESVDGQRQTETVLELPEPGCWLITGQSGEDSLGIVVEAGAN